MCHQLEKSSVSLVDGLRLFPIWAALRPTEDAAFKTLRGKGAFLVSAKYHGSSGTVGNVTILSEAGSTCRVLSPWPIAREVSVRKGSGGKTMAVRVSRTGWIELRMRTVDLRKPGSRSVLRRRRSGGGRGNLERKSKG